MKKFFNNFFIVSGNSQNKHLKLKMTITMNKRIHRLPEELVKEIFHFIMPDAITISFRNYSIYQGNYRCDKRYDVAFIGEKPFITENGRYLSRIAKKNGKHRYYLTKEIEKRFCQGCGNEGCSSRYCRGGFDYEYEYESNFIGKDLDKALLELSIQQEEEEDDEYK